MFQLASLRLPFLGRNHLDDKNRVIGLKSVDIHDIETSSDKSTRTLKHLIKANHVNNSILFHDLEFHNHAPHILGSAWILGATSDHLKDVYESELEDLEPWTDSPGEVSLHDWRDFLGKKEYARAFVDFFEDELARNGYDWKALVNQYMFQGSKPLFNGIISGLAHPLIHLGYGFELSSREVAIEGLTMAATCYNDIHKYLDDPAYTRPTPIPKSSTRELFKKFATDDRLDAFVEARQGEEVDLMMLIQKNESLLLDYWNAWDLTDPTGQFHECQEIGANLLVGTVSKTRTYDFFLVHTLTSSHACRILLPLIPGSFQVPLLRQWLFLCLSAYLMQGRPPLDWGLIGKYELEGRDLEWAHKRALDSEKSKDAHYVKGIRALGVAAKDWDDQARWFEKAAVKFAAEFHGWNFDANTQTQHVQ
ncbi:MAG: hypothetical protein M1814_002577 [Vezdaea aestivalis]|nr:MAG: hypothetical protein M1814_002577 [Vezdaea aestivalis]